MRRDLLAVLALAARGDAAAIRDHNLLEASRAISLSGGGGSSTAADADVWDDVVTLTASQEQSFLTGIDTYVASLLSECGSNNQSFKGTQIVEPTFVSEAGANKKLYTLKVSGETANGSSIELDIELLHNVKLPDQPTIEEVAPRSFLPGCVQARLDAEDAQALANLSPVTAGEGAIVAKENSTSLTSTQPGTEIKASEFQEMLDVNPSPYPDRPHDKFKTYSRGMSSSLGLPPGRKHTMLVQPQHEELVASVAPANYNPFEGTTCLTQFPARAQLFADCTTFAATAALTLNYCGARHKEGFSTVQSPVFSVQDLISCASRKMNPRENNKWAYGGGTKGASLTTVAEYIVDVGVSTAGCLPYTQSTWKEANPCRTSCVPGFTAHAMRKVKAVGIANQASGLDSVPSFNTEANIMKAMNVYGAMSCDIGVMKSFDDWSGLAGPFSPSAKGGVYMGGTAEEVAFARGPKDARPKGFFVDFHAIACYGWGTLTDGTKYWQCINSYGDAHASGHMNPRGEFRLLRKPGETDCKEGLLCHCVAIKPDYADVFAGETSPPAQPGTDAIGDPFGWSAENPAKGVKCNMKGMPKCTCGDYALMGWCADSNGLMKSACPVSCNVPNNAGPFALAAATSQPPGPDPSLAACTAAEPSELGSWTWNKGGASCSPTDANGKCTCEKLADWGVCTDSTRGAELKAACPASCRQCMPIMGPTQPCSTVDDDAWAAKQVAVTTETTAHGSNPVGCGGTGMAPCTCETLAAAGGCTMGPTYSSWNDPLWRLKCPGSCNSCVKIPPSPPPPPPACTTCTITMDTGKWAEEVSWSIDGGAGGEGGRGTSTGRYASHQQYVTTKCLSQGAHTLVGKDSYGDGWNGGTITISGAGKTFLDKATMAGGQQQTFTFTVTD